MSLELLLNIICDLAIKRNLVGYAAAGPSIYNLNNETIKEYPFIFVSPTSNVVTRKNFTDYTLTFFYVDRLLADSTNETHIFSIANDSIVNLLRQLKSLEGIVDVSEPNVRLFTETERMADRCAGGYSEVTVTVLNDANCPVFFDEGKNIMGTYIPQTLRDLNILDSLATKEYVIEYVNEHSSSGGTDVEEVKRLINEALEKYTETVDFATINGSGITSGETFNLVEKSEYDAEVERIYSAITEATPQGYDELVQEVSGNSTDITELYIAVSSLTEGVETEIDGLQQEVSSITQDVSSLTQDLSVLSGITSGNSEAIKELRTAVSANTDNIEILSGITSGVSEALQTLSGATVGIESDLADLSSGLTVLSGIVQTLGNWGIVYDFNTWRTLPNTDKAAMRAQWTAEHAEGKKVYLKATTTGNETVYLLLEGTGIYDQFRYASDAYVCHLSVDNIGAVGQSGGKVNKTNIVTTDVKATTTQLGCVKIGSGLTINNQGVLSGPGGNVSSTSVFTIWSGSQEDYDLLASKDSNTLYVII